MRPVPRTQPVSVPDLVPESGRTPEDDRAVRQRLRTTGSYQETGTGATAEAGSAGAGSGSVAHAEAG